MTDAPSSTKHPRMTRAPSRTARRPDIMLSPTNATAITHRVTATVPVNMPVSQSVAEDRAGLVGASNNDGAIDMSHLLHQGEASDCRRR